MSRPKPPRKRVAACRSYAEEKECKFGSTCYFAHGPEELEAWLLEEKLEEEMNAMSLPEIEELKKDYLRKVGQALTRLGGEASLATIGSIVGKVPEGLPLTATNVLLESAGKFEVEHPGTAEAVVRLSPAFLWEEYTAAVTNFLMKQAYPVSLERVQSAVGAVPKKLKTDMQTLLEMQSEIFDVFPGVPSSGRLPQKARVSLKPAFVQKAYGSKVEEAILEAAAEQLVHTVVSANNNESSPVPVVCNKQVKREIDKEEIRKAWDSIPNKSRAATTEPAPTRAVVPLCAVEERAGRPPRALGGSLKRFLGQNRERFAIVGGRTTKVMVVLRNQQKNRSTRAR